jgi:hypothetical protein
MLKIRSSLLVLAALSASVAGTYAQSNPQSKQGLPDGDALYKTISGLDSALFAAYNSCDLGKIGAMAADDLEFYHDQTGLAVGKQNLVDAIKNNICGKVHRELVSGTLEVYPLKGYGAVEMCVHRFTHPNDPNPGPGGEAKSIMLWQLKDGSWKLSRVISFDHHSLTQ